MRAKPASANAATKSSRSSPSRRSPTAALRPQARDDAVPDVVLDPQANLLPTPPHKSGRGAAVHRRPASRGRRPLRRRPPTQAQRRRTHPGVPCRDADGVAAPERGGGRRAAFAAELEADGDELPVPPRHADVETLRVLQPSPTFRALLPRRRLRAAGSAARALRRHRRRLGRARAARGDAPFARRGSARAHRATRRRRRRGGGWRSRRSTCSRRRCRSTATALFAALMKARAEGAVRLIPMALARAGR